SASTGPKSTPAWDRLRPANYFGVSSQRGASVLQTAPDRHFCPIGRSELAPPASCGPIIDGVAKPHSLEPPAAVDLDADSLRRPARIGFRQRAPTLARGQALPARKAIEIGPADCAPPLARLGEVPRGLPR